MLSQRELVIAEYELVIRIVPISPEGDEVQYYGDDKDHHEGKPGEERHTEVKNILDALQNMSQESKMFLIHKTYILDPSGSNNH